VLSNPDAQGAVVTFLSDPASYDGGIGHVDVIETHISVVFLAGDRAYKLKRAVRYPYVDFSTEVLRRRACEAELDLNRRTAPELYIEVRPLCRTEDGSISWGKAGQVVDWVVVMRRFNQEGLLDSLAQRGALEPRLMRDLVDHVVAFHARAEQLFTFDGSPAMAAVERTNMECLDENAGHVFAPEHVADLHVRSLARIANLAEPLELRRAAGKVRRCHGDLHLRNICLLEGRPVLFDCIEFSDELANIDVLYDLAFLLMDLEYRQLLDLSNLACNRYLDLTDDDDGLAAVPLFMSLRAAVRAHVTATAANCVDAGDKRHDKTDEARRYLNLARKVLEPEYPQLIAIGGLSGTGKSTMARRLAPLVGARPGARVLRSDVIRKRLWGVSPETPLPGTAYGKQVSGSVYEIICSKAVTALRAGYSVIIDAVSLKEQERRSFVKVAEDARVAFTGIWLEATPDLMAARISVRHDDASDASVEVLRQQLACDPGFIEWQRVEVSGDEDAAFAAVLRAAAFRKQERTE
jgi:uncharacterized protein